jgi:hypothetical protein
MKTFTAFIVCQSLDIQAETIEEAEERYSEFFDGGESCAKHEEDCDCFSFDDSNVFHYFEEENESASWKLVHRLASQIFEKFGETESFLYLVEQIAEATEEDPMKTLYEVKAYTDRQTREDMAS